MPLSLAEIKQRAITFSKDWAAASRERAEAQTFWNEFFHVFGLKRRNVAAFEEPVKNLKGDAEFIDLFWPGKLIAEHKNPRPRLGQSPLSGPQLRQQHRLDQPRRRSPRYTIVSDFARIALHDLEDDAKSLTFPHRFPQAHPPLRLHRRLRNPQARPRRPANKGAVEKFANLHEQLELARFSARTIN